MKRDVLEQVHRVSVDDETPEDDSSKLLSKGNVTLVAASWKNAVSLLSVDGRLPIWPRFLKGTNYIKKEKPHFRNLGQFALL